MAPSVLIPIAEYLKTYYRPRYLPRQSKPKFDS